MQAVVDTETAKEFMEQTLGVVAVDDLAKIRVELEAKSAYFQKHLSREALRSIDDVGLTDLLRRIFSARRKAKTFATLFTPDELKSWITDLLYGDGPIDQRFDTFVTLLDRTPPTPTGDEKKGRRLPEKTRCDVASELLHFSDPDRYWLWTRWIWDPRTRTGALPLLTSASYDLNGSTPGEIYMKVGRGIAFVHEVGDGAGFKKIGTSVFATDVFLATVYVVYAYTVLKMRMTNEFNKVMPGLQQFCRRLLGIYDRSQKTFLDPQEVSGVPFSETSPGGPTDESSTDAPSVAPQEGPHG